MALIERFIQIFVIALLLVSLANLENVSEENPELGFNTKSTTKIQVKKLKYHESWLEENDTTILNCSLRVDRDQHVVWHRKYDKMGVHVLTIGSETFISDLRIRPIRHQFDAKPQASQAVNTFSSSSLDYNSNVYSVSRDEDTKFTWNLEIRRLKKEDSALYYCVLNSDNAYGQIYKLNVLPHLTLLNETEVKLDVTKISNLKAKTISFSCKYNEVLSNPNDQIKWYFNKHRINGKHLRKRLNSANEKHHTSADETEQNQPQLQLQGLPHTNHFKIIHNVSHTTNETMSTLLVHDFSDRHNFGKYKCAYKGLVKTVKLLPVRNESTSRLLLKQSIYSLTSSASHLRLTNFTRFYILSPVILFIFSTRFICLLVKI